MNVDELLKSIKSVPLLRPDVVAKTAVLYSYSQKCFHVESLLEYIIENFKLSATGKEGDYRLLGITNTDEEAHELIEEIEAGFSFLNFKH